MRQVVMMLLPRIVAGGGGGVEYETDMRGILDLVGQRFGEYSEQDRV